MVMGSVFPAVELKNAHITNNPFVSIVIPVFNGENMIEAKIKNCLAQQYKGQFEIIIVSDRSSDRTAELVLSFKEEKVSFIELQSRMGKSAAQNQGVIKAKGDFILFTDVDSVLMVNGLQAMVDTFNFAEEGVGCVGARVTFDSANLFQRAYWFIETAVRLAESRLGILSSVSGAAMLLEKKNFRALDLDTGDDMVIPLDPISRRGALLNPVKFGFVSVSILSRKVLRWFTPFLLLGAIVAYLFSHNVWVLIYAVLAAIAAIFYFKNKSTSVFMEVWGVFLGIYDFARGYGGGSN